MILLFQQPEFAATLKNQGIDPAEIVIPQEFRFKDEVRIPLLGRMTQLTDGVKRLDRNHFSYISARVWQRALVDGGCFTKRHIGDLAQLALDQLRFIPGPGVDGMRTPDELYETISLEFAYPSAYRNRNGQGTQRENSQEASQQASRCQRQEEEKEEVVEFCLGTAGAGGDDPGKRLPEFDKDEKMKPVRLRPGKKEKKAAEEFMKAHHLARKEMLGYALARGWDLYKE